MTVDANQDDRWAGLGIISKTILFTIFAPPVQYGIGSEHAALQDHPGVSTTGIHGGKGFLDNAVGFFYLKYFVKTPVH